MNSVCCAQTAKLKFHLFLVVFYIFNKKKRYPLWLPEKNKINLKGRLIMCRFSVNCLIPNTVFKKKRNWTFESSPSSGIMYCCAVGEKVFATNDDIRAKFEENINSEKSIEFQLCTAHYIHRLLILSLEPHFS